VSRSDFGRCISTAGGSGGACHLRVFRQCVVLRREPQGCTACARWIPDDPCCRNVCPPATVAPGGRRVRALYQLLGGLAVGAPDRGCAASCPQLLPWLRFAQRTIHHRRKTGRGWKGVTSLNRPRRANAVVLGYLTAKQRTPPLGHYLSDPPARPWPIDHGLLLSHPYLTRSHPVGGHSSNQPDG